LAGGLNLYGYAGSDPINSSDPFGLCPYGQAKPDEDVSNCPKDALGNGMRLLKSEGGAKGAATIHTIAAHHVSFDLESGKALTKACGTRAHGCTQGSKITLDATADAEDMAVRVTHEATHVRMGYATAYSVQEPIAWGNALDVYSRLRGKNGRSAFYEPYFQWRTRDPVGFKRAVCRSSGGGKGC